MNSAVNMDSNHINTEHMNSILLDSSSAENPLQDMKLLPPELPDPFPHFDDAYIAANSYAASQGYALVKKRTKQSKKGVFRKAVLRCDKGASYNPAGTGKRETSSRSCECPFEAVLTLQENGWIFRVKNPDHNHLPTLPGSHPRHRNLALNETVKQMVETQTRTSITPSQIITNVRLQHKENNPLIKLKDIYNLRSYWRQKILGNLTSTQVLLRILSKSD